MNIELIPHLQYHCVFTGVLVHRLYRTNPWLKAIWGLWIPEAKIFCQDLTECETFLLGRIL